MRTDLAARIAKLEADPPWGRPIMLTLADGSRHGIPPRHLDEAFSEDNYSPDRWRRAAARKDSTMNLIARAVSCDQQAGELIQMMKILLAGPVMPTDRPK